MKEENHESVEVSPRQESCIKPESFITGEFYHIFNRGVEKKTIFPQESDYWRLIKSLKEFNTTEPAYKISRLNEKGITSDTNPLVDIIAYCVNPNHFHLLLKQKEEKGVTEFMRKLGTGYTMYFNKRYERSGVLFQGKFKFTHIERNEQLLYMSVYVNCNSEVHGIAKAESYRWCSMPEYLSGEKLLCKKDIILDQFKDIDEFKSFAKENTVFAEERKKWENAIIE